MSKNIRGAREFLIGAGKSHPNELPAKDRELLTRWYGVTPGDYERIASSIGTTRKRERLTASRRATKKKTKRKAKRKPARKRAAPRRSRGFFDWLF